MKFLQQVDPQEEGLLERCPEEVEAEEEINHRRKAMGLPEIEKFPIDDLEDFEDETEPVWNYEGALGAVPHDDILFGRNNVETSELYDYDTDLRVLRSHAAGEDFLACFKTGVDSYLDGDWATAQQKLQESSDMMAIRAPTLGKDGPSFTLLRYMKEMGNNGKAPEWWKGYRPLTSK
jgi:hypothetical protein